MIRKGIIVTRDGMRLLGGPGSGNFGHGGIPGQRGGSAPGGGYSSGNVLSNPNYHNENIDFSTSEKAAISDYKGSAYAGVNKSLFGGDSNDARAEGIIKNLDSALDKTTITGGKYYSGLGETGAKMFADMEVGEEFEYKGYISTTTEPYQTGTFKGRIVIDGKSVKSDVVIYAKHGTHAYSYGDDDEEKEVLFARSQNMRLIEVEEEERQSGDIFGTPGYTYRKYHVEII